MGNKKDKGVQTSREESKEKDKEVEKEVRPGLDEEVDCEGEKE